MTLSPGTARVVRELAREGAENRALARTLFISLSTVRWHLSEAMETASVTNRTALALWWIRAGQYANPEERVLVDTETAPTAKSEGCARRPFS